MKRKEKWVKLVKCGECKKKIPKKDTKLTSEGKRVCDPCFEKDKK